MAGKGWIKLHRKIMDNPIFNDFQLYRLWSICLLEATHKDREQPVGKQIVKLEPGQFVTGRYDLHELYNRGLKRKEKVAEYTVWRWLQSLESYGFVSINSSNKFSVVTVLNWTFYQGDEQENEQEFDQQVSNKRATSEQQVSTNKNVKNVKNEKNDKKKDIIPKIQFAEFVKLTQAEYDKLVTAHGEEQTKRMIDILDNYKGANNKKYASDYRAILNWVVKRLEEEEQRGGHKQTKHFSGGQAAPPKHNANNQAQTGQDSWSFANTRSNQNDRRGMAATSGQSDGTSSKYNAFVR